MQFPGIVRSGPSCCPTGLTISSGDRGAAESGELAPRGPNPPGEGVWECFLEEAA